MKITASGAVGLPAAAPVRATVREPKPKASDLGDRVSLGAQKDQPGTYQRAAAPELTSAGAQISDRAAARARPKAADFDPGTTAGRAETSPAPASADYSEVAERALEEPQARPSSPKPTLQRAVDESTSPVGAASSGPANEVAGPAPRVRLPAAVPQRPAASTLEPNPAPGPMQELPVRG